MDKKVIVNIIIPQDKEHDTAYIRNAIIKELNKTLNINTLATKDFTYTLLKRSIDARRKVIKLYLRFAIEFIPSYPISIASSNKVDSNNIKPPLNAIDAIDIKNIKVLIIGSGPAALFCSLKLLEYGIKPILLERGSDIYERKVSIASITRKNIVDENSNYYYGLGGAGTFSDGKLYSRSHKRGNVKSILLKLKEFGAPSDILTNTHAHIGSDLLPLVIRKIKDFIVSKGGVIVFGAYVTSFIVMEKRVKGVIYKKDGSLYKEYASYVVLAAGQGDYKLYQTLSRLDPASIENKAFALGVRVEHPRSFIDSVQYHYQTSSLNSPSSLDSLGSAEYRLTATVKDKGVYTFCMCPGGFILPSQSDNYSIVTNGMSNKARSSPYSNSAIVTQVESSDIPSIFNTIASEEGMPHLSFLYFRTFIERATKLLAQEDKLIIKILQALYAPTTVTIPVESKIKEIIKEIITYPNNSEALPSSITNNLTCNSQAAPAQMIGDFIQGIKSSTLIKTSYTPGVTSCQLQLLFPPSIIARLQEGIKKFNRKMKGFIRKDAILIASETRTSSPVRIVRDKETYESLAIKGLYPIGEGAGYAGGITSCAIDGEEAALSIINSLMCKE